MAYTALSELTASMGSAYELVIKPAYELDIENNRVKLQVSYGVRKIGANSGTYNLDAARMWASCGGNAILTTDGTHIDWDQRKDAVGTYREYASYTGTVQCNNDGTSSVYLYAKFNVGNVSMAKSAEISRTITLPRVPRASTISATPTFIGQATMITIQRASPNFTHTVQYSYSVFWETIGQEKRSDTSFTWVVPTEFYQRLFGKSITVTLYCDTYDGDTHIGQTSCEFTASLPEAQNKPLLTDCFASEANPTCVGLEGEGNLIRYRSLVRCTCTAQAKNYAYIESITVNGQEMALSDVDGTVTGTGLIRDVDTGTFVFVATDSRGFTSSYTQTFTLIPYEVVTMSYSWTRPSSVGSTVNLSMVGRFFNGSFGLKTNTLSVEVKVRRSGNTTWGANNTVTISKNGNSWQGSVSLSGISYDYSYDVWILAYDATGKESTSIAEAIFTIPPGLPVFDWGKSDFTVNRRLFVKSSIRVAKGTASVMSGLFFADAAISGTQTRMIATQKSSSGVDAIYIGTTSVPLNMYGAPLYLYFNNASGGVCFQSTTNNSYYNCFSASSNRINLGNSYFGITVQGSSVTVGTSSYPTYVYGSTMYIYVPNSAGGIMLKQKNGSSQNALWINSNDEAIIGSTMLVTRLNGTSIYANNNIVVTSDRGSKKAIEPLSDSYEKLLDKIEPQRFRYKRDEDDAPYHIGYIAQDVLAALEDVGLERGDLAAVAGEEGDLGIAYSELVPLLHKKVKSMGARIEQLEGRVEQLEGLVERLLKAQGCDAE